MTGNPEKFWYFWKENGLDKPVNKSLQNKTNGVKATDRMLTEQDRMLYALCRKEQLMNFIYQFMLINRPYKKAARYQQYFAVQETIKRVIKVQHNGKMWRLC